MISKIYWINETAIGDKCLGIMPRPRGNDWLEDEIRGLKFRGINYLVSLLDFDEMDELGLDAEAEFCDNHDIEFINFQIADGGVPEDNKKFIALVHQLSEQLKDGKKVVIHCRAGIGRSSILSAAILIRFGIDPNAVFNVIEQHRELAVPDTDEQVEWLLNLANQISVLS